MMFCVGMSLAQQKITCRVIHQLQPCSVWNLIETSWAHDITHKLFTIKRASSVRSGSRTKLHEQKPSWKREEPSEVQRRRDSFQKAARMSDLLRDSCRRKRHTMEIVLSEQGSAVSRRPKLSKAKPQRRNWFKLFQIFSSWNWSKL